MTKEQQIQQIVDCSNARKAEILRLRETADEMAEELEKKTESASMWAKKAMEAGLERNQLAAEVERLKGERDSLRNEINQLRTAIYYAGVGKQVEFHLPKPIQP